MIRAILRPINKVIPAVLLALILWGVLSGRTPFFNLGKIGQPMACPDDLADAGAMIFVPRAGWYKCITQDEMDMLTLTDSRLANDGRSNGFGVNFTGFDWVVGTAYPLRASHYDPSLCYDANGRVIANTNCDSDPTTMASGSKVADWVGGRNGIYAAACPRRPDLGWQHGTQFSMASNVYECRDTGGWINCYEPGDFDKAIANAHANGQLLDIPEIAEFNYCWVDTMSAPVAPYGSLVTDWSFGTAVPRTSLSTPSGPLSMTTAVKLLYIGNHPRMTQGWHPSVGLPDAQDWAADCRTPLYSPVPGVATVTHNGDDGLGIGNTMITIEGAGGKVTLLHGDYTVLVGSRVVGGVTRIGSEAANGNTTGCHSHVILYN